MQASVLVQHKALNLIGHGLHVIHLRVRRLTAFHGELTATLNNRHATSEADLIHQFRASQVEDGNQLTLFALGKLPSGNRSRADRCQ